jgi:hypothetical protein
MSERRYNDAEVAAIFERATRAQQAGRYDLTSGDQGMTLAQLTDIGQQVGLSPELVAQSARAVESGPPMERRFLGLPIGVGRTVALNRTLSNEDWEELVVDLRETFDARGQLRSDGRFRQWTNGNLQALVEPTPHGDRVRLRTTKRDAQAMMTGGLAMLTGAATIALMAIAGAGGVKPGIFAGLGMLTAVGVALFGSGALRLPRWARLRQQQMDDVANRLLAMPVNADVSPAAAIGAPAEIPTDSPPR